MIKYQFLVIFAVAAGIFAGAVQAVEPLRLETVTTRERPELDPLALRAGSFRIFPALVIEEKYDDNIFAENTMEESDFITHIRPELAIESDWSRNALNFNAHADAGRYSDNVDEDYQDYQIGIDGRLGMQQGNYLAGGINYARKHVPRYSPNDRDGIEPTTYHVSSSFAAYRQRLSRISFQIKGAFKQIDYNNVEGSQGTIDNQDQDRDETLGQLQVNYELFPGYSAFLRSQYKDVKYDRQFDNNGLQRSSDGYQMDLGTELFLSGVIFGEVYAGYVNREYDDPVLSDIDELTWGASLTWLPTGLTTVTLSSSRDIRETIVGTASGILETGGTVSIDHELLRNLLLNLNISARDDDFVGISRNDDYLSIGLGAKYLMSRHVYFRISYNYEERDSDTPGGVNDFTNNVIGLSIQLQL